MTSCNGNGYCLIQCECICFDEETKDYDVNDIECRCIHKYHNGYCPSTCCMPIQCRNFKYCGEKIPKWMSTTHNNMCIVCVIQMGKHTYTNQQEDCNVCFENKNMLILDCKHKICNDCWYNITFNQKPICPLCRNVNKWSK
jgi:hypothetical protein